MLDHGFAESRRPNPLGLGVVVALHGAVLGALILAPPETFKRVIFDPLETYNVPLKPPPPLPEAQPDARDKPDRVTKPDSVVNVPTADPVDFGPIDPPISDPLPLPPRPDVIPEPPAPVLVEARPDPRFASAMQPPYPSALARAEVEGKVVVRVLIGVDGRVRAVESVSATDPAFYEATEAQALKRWRFRPATKDGVPVETWRTMTVRFQLAA